uniref:Coiled-coil domain-containing protein 137 n=1 Tax=Davidia involucrata TaxID=16924 RepID=A0A5B7CAN4_DAVIN
MGGKGQRRREKNYRAAHGGSGHTRLPPPPNRSSLDAVPSKLRKIMPLFTNSSQPGSAKVLVDTERRNRGDGSGSSGVDKKRRSEDEFDAKAKEIKGECNDGHLTQQHLDHGDEIVEDNTREKRKRTKKRKRVNDLRFELAEELGGVGSKRRERKKKHLEARKKKHKKVKAEESLDFPGREEIKFGEVVLAPPKLVAIPKALKTSQDASQERLRLQAVEAYRNRKGWASRPGIHLPPPVITSPSL